MRTRILVLALLAAPVAAPTLALAHDRGPSVGLSVAFRLSAFPNLAPVPGYPVYYAPGVAANYFFHDGLFWLFEGDRWYSSAWYDGPWQYVGPEAVPAFVLRIPVGYYRSPPRWFAGWRHDAPPRWNDHWGRPWASQRRGWEHGDRHVEHRLAPLPVYQRDYRGDRYPRTVEHQRAVRVEHDRRGLDDGGRRGRDRDDHGSAGHGRDDRRREDRGRHGGRGGDDDHRGRGGDDHRGHR